MNLEYEVGKVIGNFERIFKEYESLLNRLTEITKLKERYRYCIEIIDKILEDTKYVKSMIEDICTAGLKAIFGQEYTFKINTDENSKVSFSVFKNGIEIPVEEETCGGGLIETLAVILRLATCIIKKRDCVIFDESFKHLSVDLSKNLIKFISEISKAYKIQIILVSHDSNIFNDEETRQCIDRILKTNIESNITTIEVQK